MVSQMSWHTRVVTPALRGQPGLHRFRPTQGYRVRPYLTKKVRDFNSINISGIYAVNPVYTNSQGNKHTAQDI